MADKSETSNKICTQNVNMNTLCTHFTHPPRYLKNTYEVMDHPVLLHQHQFKKYMDMKSNQDDREQSLEELVGRGFW